MEFHDRRGAFCRVRSVTAADLPALQAIYRWHVLHGIASFEETPPDLAEFSARFEAIRSRGLPYLCVDVSPRQEGAPPDERASRIAGYAYAGPYRSRSAYRFTVENSIYLDPAYAGRGIGRGLLQPLIADCAALGMRQMVAVIGDSENAASIALHRALGFRQVGVLTKVGFKFGRWVDSVLMQRALGDGTDPA
ncbi:N-acetyltransferase family protein [Dongia soli]|uniref:GNAT family N-acetyltransferase n=1 Tax=Dongia soli TaxID=600628 RepID=A0ABU5EEV0_9PROT|nr:N-acetyltransferase family protein [Dongia soli]MDY0884920.1 GNAT family N-acetyltransferase [Dongia soli]